MDLFKTLFSRKSIRDFDPNQSTSPEDVTIILRAAMASPVARCKYDDLHLTVITDKEWISEMSDYVNEKVTSPRPNAPFYNAPTLILISSKMSENPAIEYCNAGCVVQTMSLAARSLDLGHIILWAFVEHLKEHESLLKRLNLPNGFVPIVAIGIGSSSEQLEFFDRPRHVISVNKI